MTARQERMKKLPAATKRCRAATVENVIFHTLPWFNGPKASMSRMPTVSSTRSTKSRRSYGRPSVGSVMRAVRSVRLPGSASDRLHRGGGPDAPAPSVAYDTRTETVNGQMDSDGSTGSPDRTAATRSAAPDGLSVAPAATTTDCVAAVAAAVDGRRTADDGSAPPDSAPAATEATTGGRTVADASGNDGDDETPTKSAKSLKAVSSMATAARTRSPARTVTNGTTSDKLQTLHSLLITTVRFYRNI